MKLTALEIKHLDNARDARNDALVEAHQKVHALVIDHQDDACTVPEDIALQILDLLRDFGLVRRFSGDYQAISLVAPDSNGCDVVWCSLYATPEPSGRYPVCSGSDKCRWFLD